MKWRGFAVLVWCAGACSPAASTSVDGAAPASGPLDCNWLERADNCFNTTFAAARSCLPPPEEAGTFSADGRTCTYANGTVVTFDEPVSLRLPDDKRWNFTVRSGGQECLRYEEPRTGPTILRTSAGTVRTGTSTAEGEYVACPDGQRYAGKAFGLWSMGCDAGILASFLGSSTIANEQRVLLSINVTAGVRNVFICAKP